MSGPTTHADLAEKVDDLAHKVDRLTETTAGLVQAWETASGMLRFVKFIAAVGAAIFGLLAAIRAYLHA